MQTCYHCGLTVDWEDFAECPYCAVDPLTVLKVFVCESCLQPTEWEKLASAGRVMDAHLSESHPGVWHGGQE